MNKQEIIKAGCGKCKLVDGKFDCGWDSEDALTCFWATSITQQSNQFDFDANFEPIKSQIESKLAEHGLRGLEEFKEFQAKKQQLRLFLLSVHIHCYLRGCYAP